MSTGRPEHVQNRIKSAADAASGEGGGPEDVQNRIKSAADAASGDSPAWEALIYA